MKFHREVSFFYLLPHSFMEVPRAASKLLLDLVVDSYMPFSSGLRFRQATMVTAHCL